MSAIAKTIVATGATSGLGFELVKQLLAQTQPYKFILGARDVETSQAAYNGLKYDSSTHDVTIFPVELKNMKSVKTFAQQTLEKVGSDKIDFLMLNAGTAMAKNGEGPYGSKWSEPYLVNHLSQHYLTHLLRKKLEESRTRVVVVSSGAVRQVTDTNVLKEEARASNSESAASSGLPAVYGVTKFIQLLSAHWWRRELRDTCKVVAVSPGLIPGTGIGRGSGWKIVLNLTDAKSVPEGAQSIYAAFTRDDFPEDPEQIFLTSWGEWWPKDVYGLSLDKALQEKWSPSQERIETEEGVTA
ncbi:hypothetical protein F5Y15DRAFT_351486 [Xylariaceae sp. FL0016]|nr:hypothetical protein F5Y15DRAFT_351486 [Xylariaceae sp. FL0016]